MTTTCSKQYDDLPFAHRQPNHDGHCSLIHGHNWSFKFTFAAESLDECGFVIDFGKLKWLRKWLEDRFDHTLVLNEDDPWLAFIKSYLVDVTSDGKGPVDLAKIFTLSDCSCEGLAKWLLSEVNRLIGVETGHRVGVVAVEVIEDSRNSATASNV